MKTLGQKIKERRKQLRMTLEELAKAANSTKSYMWELEKKGTGRPSAKLVVDISSALQLPVTYLLDDNQEEPKSSDNEEILLTEFRKLIPVKQRQLIKIMKIL